MFTILLKNYKYFNEVLNLLDKGDISSEILSIPLHIQIRLAIDYTLLYYKIKVISDETPEFDTLQGQIVKIYPIYKILMLNQIIFPLRTLIFFIIAMLNIRLCIKKIPFTT